MILLDRFDKEAFTIEEYKKVRKGISRRLLSQPIKKFSNYTRRNGKNRPP